MNVRIRRDRVVFLDEVDRKGNQVAFVGSATDWSTAVAMRDREAQARGIPTSRIVLTPVKEDHHA